MNASLGKIALFGAVACAAACGANSQDNSVGRSASEMTGDRSTEQRRADEMRVEKQRAAQRERRAIGGGPRDTERRFSSSVSKIAGARCDREVRCGNVGPNEKYPSREDCISKTQVEKQSDINTSECTLGVSQRGLTECLKAVRDEDCGNPLDALTRLNACRSGNVCLK